MALKPGVNAGFAAGVKYWLFFLLAFTIIGYQPFLSICLGALGGIAAGMIEAWLNPKPDEAPAQSEQPAKAMVISEEPELSPRFQKYGLMGRHRRQTRASRRFSWLFRRKP